MSTASNTETMSSASKPENFTSLIKDRHSALFGKYNAQAELAWITDVATTGQGKTCVRDPLHADVDVAGFTVPLGVHPAVGGDGDAPVPGELLCAALAGCMDSTIRLIANRLAIVLTHLEVIVSAEIDVRGTLMFKPDIPVAFQKMHLSVDLETEPGTKPTLVQALLKAAETSCVVMQTLKIPPEISTQYNAVNAELPI